MFEEVEVGGHRYRIGHLDAKKQFHVARRIAPILAGMGKGATTKSENPMEQIAPIAEALSKMSEEDVDYVLDTCLAVCLRAQASGEYAPVVARAGGLMFQDIEMTEMVQLTISVIRGNMKGFFLVAAGQLPQGA